eukprot:PhM_4_TR14233/c1_g1_i1/m.12423/K10798/PARP; poly [ADP-ribose] polymerase
MQRQDTISLLPPLEAVLDDCSFIFGFDNMTLALVLSPKEDDIARAVISNWGGRVQSSVDNSVAYILSDQHNLASCKDVAEAHNIPVVHYMWLSVCSDCGRVATPSDDMVLFQPGGDRHSPIYRSPHMTFSVDESSPPAPTTVGFTTTTTAPQVPETEKAFVAPLQPNEYNEKMTTTLIPGMWHILHCCELEQNKNKFYVMELHMDPNGTTARILTHYGRTDDLVTNPARARREARCYSSRAAAEAAFSNLHREKIHVKGYRPVKVSKTFVGSYKLQAEVDNRTARTSVFPGTAAIPDTSSVPAEVMDFVKYVYDEAEKALTKTFIAKITRNGIETPLGVLQEEQIAQGQQILDEMQQQLFSGASKSIMVHLSTQLYTIVPHHLGGRQRSEVTKMVVDSLQLVERKRELLQLMSDMTHILESMPRTATSNTDSGVEAELKLKYCALRCTITQVDPSSTTFKDVSSLVVRSQARPVDMQVKNVYRVRKETEEAQYRGGGPGERQLFHASRIGNWVGILSRGLLLPKAVLGLGGKRTNVGWLGSGLYFTDMSCAATRYSSPGERGTALLLVAGVTVGTPFVTDTIMTELSAPPAGYDSVLGKGGDFEDNEYVVYENHRHLMQYVVEFTATPLPPPKAIPQDRLGTPQKIAGTTPSSNVSVSATHVDAMNLFPSRPTAASPAAPAVPSTQLTEMGAQLNRIEATLKNVEQLSTAICTSNQIARYGNPTGGYQGAQSTGVFFGPPRGGYAPARGGF